ncbi:MAG: YafY family transcriptional regulator [Prevotella sp.]|nr:YafY family transcriptional regulator [Staphylococcus sp.]MCM1351071.1 YafY family transcriptional regulator [Prevotella sp.]
MKTSRLFEMIYILLEKPIVTTAELAKHFEVSERTIMRDLDVLLTAGIPVQTTRGQNGGVFLSSDYVLNKTHLTEEEQSHILFALQSISSTQNIDMEETLSKLSSLFQKPRTNWIEIDFSRWGNALSDQTKFNIVKEAILKNLTLSFSYVSSYGQTTNRRVYPLKFILKSNAWYVQAYCLSKEDYRIFKLNRMINVEMLTTPFDGSKYIAPPFDGQEQYTHLIHLQLWVSKYLAYRVYDEFDLSCIREDKEKNLIVEIDLPHDAWIYGYLLTFGDGLRVLEPKCVQEELLKRVEKIQSFYKI